MNHRDPKITALLFNECINNGDIVGIQSLMSKDHKFIDRKGEITDGKESMTQDWINFFKEFPGYKNTFLRVDSRGNQVVLLGYADWPNESKKDYAIWVAKIKKDLVSLWQIYENTEENKKKLLD